MGNLHNLAIIAALLFALYNLVSSTTTGMILVPVRTGQIVPAPQNGQDVYIVPASSIGSTYVTNSTG
ncbi:unnamed protein product [Acanthoscelides obtectus]|uniref:Uncharacterized protein n=1 Tax=Acanthoscelides obtectus TaxID=200917 RepID=A0A9P0LLB4_ACAOB|nr:unnamed protein product [Acanthoscelides obtectus]CAK1644845.1 hypothetical protein AOBTE_LOCUS13957 [Acanthoscelides obtectus]